MHGAYARWLGALRATLRLQKLSAGAAAALYDCWTCTQQQSVAMVSACTQPAFCQACCCLAPETTGPAPDRSTELATDLIDSTQLFQHKHTVLTSTEELHRPNDIGCTAAPSSDVSCGQRRAAAPGIPLMPPEASRNAAEFPSTALTCCRASHPQEARKGQPWEHTRGLAHGSCACLTVQLLLKV